MRLLLSSLAGISRLRGVLCLNRRASAGKLIDAEEAHGDVPGLSPGIPGSRWSPFAMGNPGLNSGCENIAEVTASDANFDR